MAGETLLTASELLDGFPDNASGLISAVDSRNFVVSATPAVGFVEDDPVSVPYVMPMTDGVPVDFMQAMPAQLFAGNFWKLVNQQLVPSYVDFGVTVPPGTQRLNDGSVLLNVQKLGGGSATYQFQGTEGGQFTGEPIERTIANVPTFLAFQGVRLYDVSLAQPVSFQVTPVGTSDDLQVNDVRISMTGVML